MAFGINIDTVYQTVQAIANKEQRGYITPQEFNLFANQSQQDIFEQYFYDLNAFKQKTPEDHEIGDSVSMIRNKLEPWTNYNANVIGGSTLPPNARNGRIFLNKGGARHELPLMSPNQVRRLRASPWHREGFSDAVYFEDGYNSIQVWSGGGSGQITSGITCESVEGRPNLVYWGYNIINEEPTYDPNTSEHFELHDSEQPDLVIKILELAGISIKDPGLYQSASQEESQNLQQENK